MKQARAGKPIVPKPVLDLSYFDNQKPIAVIDRLHIEDPATPILMLGLPSPDGTVRIFPHFTDKGAAPIIRKALETADAAKRHKRLAGSVIRFLEVAKAESWPAAPAVGVIFQGKERGARGYWFIGMRVGGAPSCLVQFKLPYLDFFPPNELIVMRHADTRTLRKFFKKEGVFKIPVVEKELESDSRGKVLGFSDGELKRGTAQSDPHFPLNSNAKGRAYVPEPDFSAFVGSELISVTIEGDQYAFSGDQGGKLLCGRGIKAIDQDVAFNAEFVISAARVAAKYGKGIEISLYEAALEISSETGKICCTVPAIDETGSPVAKGWRGIPWAEFMAKFGVSGR